MKWIQGITRLKVLEGLASLALFCTSSYFISEMVKEYLTENTNFSITEQTIAREDLPTFTICIATRKQKKDEVAVTATKQSSSTGAGTSSKLGLYQKTAANQKRL